MDHMTVPEALEKLASYGSARQIADHLQLQGIKGDRSRASSCVVVSYLQKMEFATYSLSVVPSSCFKLEQDCPHGRINWVDADTYVCSSDSLPEEVDKLAVMFDKGELPELEL